MSAKKAILISYQDSVLQFVTFDLQVHPLLQGELDLASHGISYTL
jgi:hypothetical protein